MFLLPFLKYFKPFRWRLISAVIALVFVGLISVVPILILRETVNIFAMQVREAGGEIESGELDATSILTAGTIDDGSEADGAAAPEQAIRTKIDEELEGLLGRAYAGPRDWVGAQAEAMEQWYVEAKREHPLLALRALVIALILFTVIKGLAQYLAEYQMAYTFFLTNLIMREDIYHNVLRQDYLFFNRHSPGYLLSRINSDVNAIRNILQGLISSGVQQPVTIIVMAGMLFYLSTTLTLWVMLVLPVVVGVIWYFARVLRKNTRRQKKKSDELSSTLTESLHNIRLVKAFGTEGGEIQKFHKTSMALFKHVMARRLAKFGSSPIMEFIASIAIGGVLLAGGMMIVGENPTMRFSDFVAYLFTLSRFHRPLKNMAAISGKYQVARVSGERMKQMLDLKPKLVDDPEALPFEKLKQGIELEGVGFSYGDKQILSEISFKVRVGEQVAFAGPSGGGKTTLVNMIARLFDPSEGRIVVDGVDLRELRVRDWRDRLAIVTQETVLFNDTIANNIAYGSPEVDLARVEDAARAANAHEFIMKLDGGRGYETMVGPAGARLSGGQRQRLAIARALYRDPQILILDEATSALDAESQALVQEALAHLMQGRTTFIIAHRISTIRDVDCIYFLDHGRIVEQGRHEELIARRGAYARMVERVGGTGILEEELDQPGVRTPLSDPAQAGR